MVVVLNPYFMDSILSGAKSTFTTRSNIVMGKPVEIATERLKDGFRNAEAELIIYARVTPIDALPLQVLHQEKILKLGGEKLTREQNKIIIKNEGFKKESQFWEAFEQDTICWLVRFNNMQPVNFQARGKPGPNLHKA